MQTYSVRLRERGQLTIPQSARDNLAVKEGDTLTLIQIDGLLLLGRKQPLVPQLSEQFSKQMDEAGVSLADLLEGLAVTVQVVANCTEKQCECNENCKLKAQELVVIYA